MISITVMRQDKKTMFRYNGEKSLLEAILSEGIYLSSSCAGMGTCGKCKVQVLEGYLEITGQDIEKLSKDELSQGIRLACMSYPKSSCTIRLVTGDEKDFSVVTDGTQNPDMAELCRDTDYVLAVDIGTTTLAISLVGASSHRVYDTYTAINQQRAYGADVISRIKAATEGKEEVLKKSIQKDLSEGIHIIIKRTEITSEQIRMMVISGNTTMQHLLMGYACKTLGSYPFTPVDISMKKVSYAEVFGSNELNFPVVLLPGISAFVGSDITAGLLACEFDRTDHPCMLIDLGTNGEMAIGNREKIIVTSTAAGPAFEGGNISCGIGSVAGAICNVDVEENNHFSFHTIANQPPVGICGTGVIELIFEMLGQGMIDRTGLLSETYFDQGFLLAENREGGLIRLTQKDIREIQMAKSAVRAGIDILLKHFKVSYKEIETVYLAGGFGYQMNIEKAIGIGLLPEEFAAKVKIVGNSALKGAKIYCFDSSSEKRLNHLINVSTEIHLSKDDDFNDLYINGMYF